MTDYTKFCTTNGEINTVCEASWWIRNASLYGIKEWAAKAKAKLEALEAGNRPALFEELEELNIDLMCEEGYRDDVRRSAYEMSHLDEVCAVSGSQARGEPMRQWSAPEEFYELASVALMAWRIAEEYRRLTGKPRTTPLKSARRLSDAFMSKTGRQAQKKTPPKRG